MKEENMVAFSDVLMFTKKHQNLIQNQSDLFLCKTTPNFLVGACPYGVSFRKSSPYHILNRKIPSDSLLANL